MKANHVVGRSSSTIQNHSENKCAENYSQLSRFAICFSDTCGGFTDGSYLSFRLKSISGYTAP